MGAGCCLSSCTSAVSSRVSELCEYVLLLFPFRTESLVNHFGSDAFRIRKTSTAVQLTKAVRKKGAALMSYAARLVVVFVSSQQKHSFQPFSGFRLDQSGTLLQLVCEGFEAAECRCSPADNNSDVSVAWLHVKWKHADHSRQNRCYFVKL